MSYKKKEGSQDFRQRASVSVECLIELYRVIVSTCLIWFVPHNCGTQPCGWIQPGIPNIAIYLNLVTFVSFLALYGMEIYRENMLITHLEVNPALATDNKSVGEVIATLDPKTRKTLYFVDTVYFSYGGYCMCIFTANTVFSGVILLHELDNRTITTFVTDILFMMTKLYRIYYVMNTDKNIFYSAYMTNFVQFNDLDPTKREWSIPYIPPKEEILWEENWFSCKSREEEEDDTV